jgi:hypothetical protein
VLWTFVPVYFVHLLDERFCGVGTANWSTAYSPVDFSNYAWLWVNATSMLVFALVVVLIARRTLPEWIVVGLSVHLLLHALMRVVGTVVFASLWPGLVSGVLLCLPLASWSLIHGYRNLPRQAARLGVLVGALSFQPLWHGVLYPFLSGAPPAA